MGRPRILVAGLWHETNTFSAVPTRYEDFLVFQYAVGDAMLRYRDTNTEIGGMIAAADATGLDLAFGLFAGAVPSGLVQASAYRRLLEETLASVKAVGPVDGVLLAIHGALVAEGSAYAAAEWIAAIRNLVGHDRPVVATFDLHANLSEQLVATADVFIGYDTYPHVDMAEKGKEAAQLLAKILASGRRPHKALRKLPLLTVPQTQGTDDHPALGIYAKVKEARQLPGILAASVAMGFPYSDRDDLGMAVLAYGDAEETANAAADAIASDIWRARHEFVPRLESPKEAVSVAGRSSGTTILVDVADNVGGGAPGDGTVLLDELVARVPIGAAIVIWDPIASARAATLGIGARFTGEVGGARRPPSRRARRDFRHSDFRRTAPLRTPQHLYDRADRRPRRGRCRRLRWRHDHADREAGDALRFRPPPGRGDRA